MKNVRKKISRPNLLIFLILIVSIFYTSFRLYHLTISVRHTFFAKTHDALHRLSTTLAQIDSERLLSTFPWAFFKEQFAPYPGEFLLIDDKNEIVYYTLEHFSQKKVPLRELAQQLHNPSFKKLEKILQKNYLQSHYTNSLTGENITVFIQPFAHYKLIYLLSDKDIQLNQRRIYHLQLLLLILMLISATFFCKVALSGTELSKKALLFSMTYTGIWTLGVILLMLLINHHSFNIALPLKPLTQSKNITPFLDQYHDDVHIPTGIYLYSLNISTPNNILLTGYIWQVYQKNDGLTRAIRLPQATKIEFLNSYTHQEEDKEIVGWFVRAELTQQFNYVQYPFDINTISIALEHPDITKKVLLIPDLKAYAHLAPHAIPGIDVALNISGIRFINSYFGYQPYAPDTNFGLKHLENYHHERLTFNVTLKRGILNAFIMYFIPLLVILISMFATVCIVEAYRRSTESRAFSSIAAYTALFFSIILIHTSLRGEFRVGEALYIEYLFFLTYIILLLLELHALWTSLEKNAKHYVPYVEFLYWPFTLTAWFMITLYVFF